MCKHERLTRLAHSVQQVLGETADIYERLSPELKEKAGAPSA